MNAKRLEDAVMDGQAVVETWYKDFAEQWDLPVQQRALKGMYARLPDAAKEQIKASDPTGFAELQKILNRRKG